jgi:F-type H+-transporting ATPase subunit alpha
MLSQGQHSPMPLEEEILVLSGVVRGLFDDTPPERLAETELDFLNWVREHRRELLRSLATAEVPTPELDAALDEALGAFADTLLAKA